MTKTPVISIVLDAVVVPAVPAPAKRGRAETPVEAGTLFSSSLVLFYKREMKPDRDAGAKAN